MRDLQLIGVHEDGEHLLLSGPDDTRFRIPVDEALRAAIRRDRPRLGKAHSEVEGGLRPRDVQALIRAGASAEEAASRAGWTVEKVHRYEGPIVAEREHIAGLARTARLRAPSGAHSGSAPTLSVRVAERLKGRGVDTEDAGWDSWRAEGGPWTVVLTFAAGGRQRQASWSFNLADRTVSAADDEARWLSEDVQATNGPIPAPDVSVRSARATGVYDVEAEGGLQPMAPVEHQEDPLDLMTAMRKRSTARGRRKTGGHRGSPKVAAGDGHADEQSSDHRSADHRSADQQGLEQMLPEIADGLRDRADEVSAHDGKRVDGRVLERSSSQETETTPEPVEASAHRGPPSVPGARPAARKSARPSVPAWDEIMFGSRPDADRSSS